MLYGYISLSLYIYIYIHTYIYIYVSRSSPGRIVVVLFTRKGTNGVSTNGVTAIFKFFDRGTFWVLPLTYLYLPKSARAYLFPQSVKIDTFAAAPVVLTPFVRSQRLQTNRDTKKWENGGWAKWGLATVTLRRADVWVENRSP